MCAKINIYNTDNQLNKSYQHLKSLQILKSIC